MRSAVRSVLPLRCAGTAKTAGDLLDIAGKCHPFYGALRCLWMRHPEKVIRKELIWSGGFAEQGPVCGPAAFHFWLIQVNIDLPRLGWRIAEKDETYWLERVA